MIENFRLIKLQYKDYLILYKSGSFYVSFDEDAMILNKLFKYKILNLKNNIKVGFPATNLEKIEITLSKKKINFIVIEEENIRYKETFKDNKFEEYTKDMYSTLINKRRIKNINSRLELISDISDISDKLSRIERVIDE